MKKIIGLSVILLGFMMVGCDSTNSDNNTTDNTTPFENTTPSGTTASSVTPLTCENGNNGFTIKSGTDGDITFNCDFSQNYGYALAEGVSSINVTNIVSEIKGASTCSSSGNSTFSITTNYAANSVHYTASSSKIGNVNCTEIYNFNVVPTVIAGAEDIEALFEWEQAYSKDDPSLVSTTCPNEFYDDSDSDIEEERCSGSSTINYTLTDDAGKKHLVSIENIY